MLKHKDTYPCVVCLFVWLVAFACFFLPLFPLRYYVERCCLRYRHRYLWTDGTVAYYMRLFRHSHGTCSSFPTRRFKNFAHLSVHCDNRRNDFAFLCELPAAPTEETSTSSHQEGKKAEREQYTVHLTPPSDHTWPLPAITCPAGHMTLEMLACDAESACWLSRNGVIESEVWGVPVRSSCRAPVTSLPAMMACDSGVQHVPYSLVCDHQQQCDDGSDESFCVFQECSKDKLLSCGRSSQVRIEFRNNSRTN